MKKIPVLLSFAIIISFFVPISASAVDYTIYGTNVEYPTQEQIALYSSLYETNFEARNDTYDREPVLTAPFQAGQLSQTSLTYNINAINLMRYISGIDYDVTISEEYNTYAAHAAVLLSELGYLSHYPARPSNMDSDFFDLAYKGTASGNLAIGVPIDIKSLPGFTPYWYNSQSLVPFSYMADQEDSNLATVGHRRWILNPTMEEAGFGSAYKHSIYYGDSLFSVMYAHDGALEETDEYGVVWPAQNMPIEFFDANYPWSYTLGEPIYGTFEVNLTRLSDGRTWNFGFNGANDGYLGYSNDNMGQVGCIIFRPNDIKYNVGDVFNVNISGEAAEANYFVTFFSLTNTGVGSDASLTRESTPSSYVPAPAVQPPVTTPTPSTPPEPTPIPTNDPTGTITEIPDNYITGASEWAVAEIESAVNSGLMDNVPYLLNSYTQNITREEFCSLVMSLLSWIDVYTPSDSLPNPFVDTNNIDVINAYHIGIINGTSETTFTPNASITRQELATMLSRFLAIFGEFEVDGSLPNFQDSGEIANWAYDAVREMYFFDIIKGISDTQIAPKGLVTREQAILMANRMLVNLANIYDLEY